ncbi:hypothetical protein [Desulfoscipio gibsoniae]|uniref:Uncharacterized protein n=1 Tax=Desulfoscipio gibsoniae DSM 7213 TaxID=767817 RepID=R4KR66_9FIRM|nr:hypothetical protein [Desulfoscipio gibsoniae]AGL03055.1 hypothetical protein Desgi_3733 [Desulfoscipio gibsoniae DSM 7213]
MHSFNDGIYAQSASDLIGTFLEAINNRDTLAFWRMLDKQGQGYFMGMWFYAMGNADLAGISLLAEDENFLKDALDGIVIDLKRNLSDLLDNPQIGELQYVDGQHAQVAVSSGGAPGEGQITDYIPLVLELASAGTAAGCDPAEGNVGMTCWKINTLKCFSIQKN